MGNEIYISEGTAHSPSINCETKMQEHNQLTHTPVARQSNDLTPSVLITLYIFQCNTILPSFLHSSVLPSFLLSFFLSFFCVNYMSLMWQINVFVIVTIILVVSWNRLTFTRHSNFLDALPAEYTDHFPISNKTSVCL